MDGIRFTLLGAQGTSDTSSLADLLHSRSLVMGRTLNQMLCRIRHQLDQVFWTGSHTFATGYTFLLINHSHAVYHMDRIKLTCF